MANPTVLKTFRLKLEVANFMKTTAETQGVSQQQVFNNLIIKIINKKGKKMSKGKEISSDNITQDSEVYQTLKELGIATPSGFAGHHVSEWIKKEIEKDNKKGHELLLAMIVGLNDYLVKNNK
jgi:hypothetical protein